jgi:hypothetical protein
MDDLRIFGYIHVATIGSWKQILGEQLALIRTSGLADLCEEINVVKVGTERLDFDDIDVRVVEEYTDVGLFEFPTLERLHRDSSRDGYSWYIHLKGVSKTATDFEQHRKVYHEICGVDDLAQLVRNERLWRKYMEFFLLGKHRDCVTMLQDHDICGVQWRQKPYPHYSGNFWWARNDYIRQLLSPEQFRSSQGEYRDFFGSTRSLAEFWVGSGSPRVGVLWNNAYNLYHIGIMPREYRKIKVW